MYYSSICVYVKMLPLHPFYSQLWLACHSKTWNLAASLEEFPPYGIPLRGPPCPWTFSDDLTAWGIPHIEKVSSNNWEGYNLGVRPTLVTRFHCTQKLQNTIQAGFLSSPGDFWWLESPRWRYCWPLGLIAFQMSWTVGNLRLLMVDQSVR